MTNKLSFILVCRRAAGESRVEMSHTPTVFSPAGTTLIDRTVGEIVAESPLQARVFQSFGIDFCCQGGRTLREACERKSLAPEEVVAKLEAALTDERGEGENPAQLPPAELVEHIVGRHHAYLRDELPRLLAMASRVAQVHGGHTPSLVEVDDVLRSLAQELYDHLQKEERILFPAIVALSLGGATMPLGGPIGCMIHEHDDAGAALSRLRELTAGFVPPAEACNTYRALFAGLEELESDLHRHIHLENSVLFPAALALFEAA